MLVCLRETNDLLVQISKNNSNSPVSRNITDLIALITNSVEKLELAFNPPAPDPEKTPQEKLMECSKLMLSSTKAILSCFKNNTPDKILESAKEIVQSMASIKSLVEKISEETCHRKILEVSEKLHGIQRIYFFFTNFSKNLIF